MQPARERPGTAAQKGIGHRMQTALMGWVHQLGTLEYWEALLAGFEGPVSYTHLAHRARHLHPDRQGGGQLLLQYHQPHHYGDC